jgi:starch phosphorylase
MFHQEIHDGWQVELTEYWLRYGNPWEIRRPHVAVDVLFAAIRNICTTRGAI